jgi:hypothetical protein
MAFERFDHASMPTWIGIHTEATTSPPAQKIKKEKGHQATRDSKK